MPQTPGTTISIPAGLPPALQALAADIQRALNERDVAPVSCFTIATAASAPLGTKYPEGSMIYVRDTDRPAWNDATGTWRYADGTGI